MGITHLLQCIDLRWLLRPTGNRRVAGQSDYGILIDREWTIDGQARAADTAAFSLCHINHSARRCNVVRRTIRGQRRVSFYTSRTVKVPQLLPLSSVHLLGAVSFGFVPCCG